MDRTGGNFQGSTMPRSIQILGGLLEDMGRDLNFGQLSFLKSTNQQNQNRTPSFLDSDDSDMVCHIVESSTALHRSPPSLNIGWPFLNREKPPDPFLASIRGTRVW
jgi:hypothetical protein